MKLLKYPDPKLRQVSTPVIKFDSYLTLKVDEMRTLMYSCGGVGLAAVQTGWPKRIFLVRTGEREDFVVINPVITSAEGSQPSYEACLSSPDLPYRWVERLAKLSIEYQDIKGDPQSLDAEGLMAVIIQHETDHLDGVLYFDKSEYKGMDNLDSLESGGGLLLTPEAYRSGEV